MSVPLFIALIFAADGGSSHLEVVNPIPDHSAAVHRLLEKGTIAKSKGDNQAAYDYFRLANRLAPNAETMKQLAQVETILQLDDADIHFKEAMRLLHYKTTFEAAPDHSAEIKDLLEKGIDARRKGQHPQAYEYFLRANNLSTSIQTLSHLGLAEFSTQRWAAAEIHLRDALELLPVSSIGPIRTTLQSALSEVGIHLASVHFAGTPGAIVSIAGSPVTRLPSESLARLPEGAVRFHVTALGYEDQDFVLEIKGGQELKARFDLHRPLPASTKISATSARAGGAGWRRVVGFSLLGAISFVAVEIGVTDMVKPLFSGSNHALRGGLLAGAGVLGLSVASVALWRGSSTDSRLALVLGPASLGLNGRF